MNSNGGREPGTLPDAVQGSTSRADVPPRDGGSLSLSPSSLIAQQVQELRTLQMVAGQSAVEQRDPLMAQADGRFAEYCRKWADALEGLLPQLEQAFEKLQRQASGQCDGCGEELGDAFCATCLTNERDNIIKALRQAGCRGRYGLCKPESPDCAFCHRINELPARAGDDSPDQAGRSTATDAEEQPNPCPMCPVEIRNLHAVAQNMVNLFDDPSRFQDKFAERAGELRRAVAKVQPLSDAHFADPRHSHQAPEAGAAPVVDPGPVDRRVENKILIATNDALDGTGLSIARSVVKGVVAYQVVKVPAVLAPAPDSVDGRVGLAAIADRLEGLIDEQTYDERLRADFDLPDDADLHITITMKDFRDLSAAIALDAGKPEGGRVDRLRALAVEWRKNAGAWMRSAAGDQNLDPDGDRVRAVMCKLHANELDAFLSASEAHPQEKEKD